jgi:hypothetical protein
MTLAAVVPSSVKHCAPSTIAVQSSSNKRAANYSLASEHFKRCAAISTRIKPFRQDAQLREGGISYGTSRSQLNGMAQSPEIIK